MIDFDFLLAGNEEFEIDKPSEVEMDFTTEGATGGYGKVVDVVEPGNKYAVQSGAVYNHVAEQVGNIEILLGTI